MRSSTCQTLYDRSRRSESAREQLLHPVVDGRRVRLALCDARLDSWRPLHPSVTAGHTELQVELAIVAVRYLTEQITGQHIHGSQEYAHAIDLRWTLVFSPSEEPPWQLTHTTSPASRIAWVDDPETPTH